ncbi:MAG: anthranilate synthase component I [Deltaproteobacteria bacterium GWC2_42_51]|nr:MAG: anthranilate synthase component I [Deltaproteobacteria bacterium GWA2_42_85]OGP36793.1 MAG: anthranilate synthase component I [Deltaproteobacteria bacterium GWC2_42_51]OGP39128.1 MAG: anthranilate synthase component I [Deltaproteobacteria bacterium GWD2_42_10]OGP47977.1 MAG: anthranilate synthase component I [Deltaproteobacteria bacterium GWF2_42_12]OGQ24801.1 MAG: anthranilate synthase component I [Deltaproteobacteria bacterium RIFCSPHIGHO2_02_FULL_42_44]OGQ36849.1 MAG: anthranilate s
MYFPSLEGFIEKAKKGNLVPVFREIMADMETPVSAFKSIDKEGPVFLLESVEGGEKWGRYSFLGVEPKLVFRGKGEEIEIIEDKKKKKITGDPIEILRQILSKYRPVVTDGLPRFYGGAVGYIGYDTVRFFEDLPDLSPADISVYDAVFVITDTLLIFDNLEHKIKVIANAVIEEGDNPTDVYKRAIKKIDGLVKRLKTSSSESQRVRGSKSQRAKEVVSNFTKEKFIGGVLKAKEYIQAGDIIQVVLSQRFETCLDVEPFDIYRALRVINPSPYMFYLRLDGIELIGSSPEILVRVEGRDIDVRPIAGTRPRGKDEAEDKRLEQELLKDPKEIAEHIMLVDLGRNDIGRVAETGSVSVNELMVVEKYSHVMHIVSNVHGQLKRSKDSFDALRACFPAGTLTGAPKVRAMEIIEEIELCKRGAYGGSVGYFGFSGNMDMAITIRTLVIKDGKIYIQAGAGIVADSVPEKEYQETINKAKAMLKAVEMAREGLE